MIIFKKKAIVKNIFLYLFKLLKVGSLCSLLAQQHTNVVSWLHV